MMSNQIPHRPEKYWTAMNVKGTEVRRKANALLKEILPRPTRAPQDSRKKLNSLTKSQGGEMGNKRNKYTDDEMEMIRHIASHSSTLKGQALWVAFHAKASSGHYR